jgi:hypothetical protein
LTDSKPSRFARRDQARGLLLGLRAVDRLLHLGREVLDAHAEPVEARLAQRLELRHARDRRVHLDADLGVRQRRESARVIVA